MIKTAKLGNTTYLIEPGSQGVAHIQRINAEGTKELWVPDELLVAYVAEMVRKNRNRLSDAELLGLVPERSG